MVQASNAQLQASFRVLLRLRRAFLKADDELREDIGPALSELEDRLGPTISRRRAAQLLGVSHTALDRWVTKGEVATAPTSSGRSEIPVFEVVDLLDRLDRLAESDGSSSLAAVIHERQRDARSAVLGAQLLPRRVLAAPRHGHRRAELRSLAYHRLVAAQLDDVAVAEARRQLKRWIQKGAIHAYWADRWRRVLDMPPRRIAEVIGSDSEAGRELRQNSPFVGVLNEQERNQLNHVFRELVK